MNSVPPAYHDSTVVKNLPYASAGARTVAFSVDALLALALCYVGLRQADGYSLPAITIVAVVVVGALWLANRVVLVGVTGQSIGHRLVGLEVVSDDPSLGRIGIPRAFARELLLLLAITPLVPLLILLSEMADAPATPLWQVGLVATSIVAVLLALFSSAWGFPKRQMPAVDGPSRSVVIQD